MYFFFYLGGRWFSKTLRNIWGWYVKILTVPYKGGWVVWKRPKTPLRNIKMAPKKVISWTTEAVPHNKNNALFEQALVPFFTLSV